MQNLPARAIIALIVLCLTACGGGGGGGGGDTQTESIDKVVASVAVISGDGQTATVGTDVPLPLVAKILNQKGKPISGQVVNFVVTLGGGHVFAGAAMSDSDGFARERWTLGTVPGPQRVEVRAVDATGAAVVFEKFDAVAVVGAPHVVAIVSGDGQSARQSHNLPDPIKLSVKDDFGNPTPAIQVVFTVHNGGTILPVSTSTDLAGEASATWTLGPATGAQTVDVTVAGIPGVTFVATSAQTPSPTLVLVSGSGQTWGKGLPLPDPVKVILRDGDGIPMPGVTVTFSADGGGSALPASVATDSDGFASAVWTLGPPTGGQFLSASVAGLPPVTFTATATLYPKTTVFIVSGDGQTLPQQQLLANPLVVEVRDANGKVLSGGGLQVVYSVTGGEGKYYPPTAMSAFGYNWPGWPGWYFDTPGQKTGTASLAGATPTTFSIEVLPSSHLYDGYYSCENIPFNSAYIHDFSIENGSAQLALRQQWALDAAYPSHICDITGTIDETTGVLTATVTPSGSIHYDLPGQFVIDSAGRATGAGTSTRHAWGEVTPGPNWSCVRQ